MKRYTVAMTIDRRPPGTDVTDLYAPDVRDRLVQEGYLEIVDDEIQESEPTAEPKEPTRTTRVRKVNDGS